MSPPLNLFGVLSETRHVISAHSRHFLALTVLFLFPLSFLTTTYSTLQSLLSSTTSHHHPTTLLRHTPSSNCTVLIFPLIYTLLSLCAVGSISFSVIHGFFSRPVKLVNSLFSLFHSSLPLLFTLLCAQVIQFSICLIVGLVPFLCVKGFEFLGLEIDYSSVYFLGVCGVVGVILLLCLVYFQVNWALAFVVVVVERSWGFEPLRRSAKLVKGTRGLILSNMLLFGIIIGFTVWLSTGEEEQDFGDKWKCWAFVIRTVLTTTMLMLFLFNSIAAQSVMYLYCKGVNGELAGEIAEEFAREYVSLPFDDGKVPHVVSVINV